MKVPASIIGMEKLIRQMGEAAFDQIAHLATLPGTPTFNSESRAHGTHRVWSRADPAPIEV
jgi:RNA-splicing ligase RtcB